MHCLASIRRPWRKRSGLATIRFATWRPAAPTLLVVAPRPAMRCAKPGGVENRISQRWGSGRPAPPRPQARSRPRQFRLSVKAGSGYPRQPTKDDASKVNEPAPAALQPASTPRMSVIGSNRRLRQPSAFDADEQRHHFVAGDAVGGDQRYQRPVFLRKRSDSVDARVDSPAQMRRLLSPVADDISDRLFMTQSDHREWYVRSSSLSHAQ